MSHYLRLPTPQKFLGFLDLQHGAEVVLMSLLINKCSGIFGVMAIFTGAPISIFQLSMYIYSLCLFGLLCYLMPSIRQRLPLATLSFAYLYFIDSVINIAYTVLFGYSWFTVLASKHQEALSAVASAGRLIDEASGFTSPAVNVTKVDVIAEPAGAGQAAVAVGTPGSGSLGAAAGVLQPESATSIFIIAIFWAIRLYFLVIVFAYARQVVRSSATPDEGPFEGRNGGAGWQGRLGRTLISVGDGYWRGDGWAHAGAGKFRRTTLGDGRRFRRDRLSVEV